MSEVAITETPTVPESGMALRKGDERGQSDRGWLKARFSFSFAEYHDPKHMRFQNLRVMNDDRIAPNGGFPMHPHKNAEIFSYVLEGAIEHTDSMGNGSRVKAGGIQYMSAGSGVQHSEFNPSSEEGLRLLQVWLLPKKLNTQPDYDTLDIAPEDKDGKLKLFISIDGRDGSIASLADADIYAATLKGAQKIEHVFAQDHKGWVQIARGSLTLNGTPMSEGDGMAISQNGAITLENGEEAEFLLFDFLPQT